MGDLRTNAAHWPLPSQSKVGTAPEEGLGVLGCYGHSFPLFIVTSTILISCLPNPSLRIQINANHPEDRKGETPRAHLDWESKNQFIISRPLVMLASPVNMNKVPFSPLHYLCAI